MSRASSNPNSTDAKVPEARTPLAFLLLTLFPIRKCPFAILKVEEDKARDFVVIFIAVVNSNGVVISL
jgi:hypothetical protein